MVSEKTCIYNLSLHLEQLNKSFWSSNSIRILVYNAYTCMQNVLTEVTNKCINLVVLEHEVILTATTTISTRVDVLVVKNERVFIQSKIY